MKLNKYEVHKSRECKWAEARVGASWWAVGG